MPVIEINYRDLSSLLGKEMPIEELVEKISMLGADIEGYSSRSMTIEFFPDRPDLYSAGGVARALRSFLAIEMGLKRYELKDFREVLKADGSIAGIRDYVVACEVSSVKLNDLLIQELMDLQEDLHWALGRDRKKVAIGVHDSSKIEGPYLYKTAKPEEVSFVPLDMEEEMSLKEILEKHPKGIQYAHIIDRFDRYPIILDSKGDVLSMPPIINGELTRVMEETTDFFVEITGTDFTLVSRALNIVATAFAERGWGIRQVEIEYPDKVIKTPDFSPVKRGLGVEYVNRMLGLDLTSSEIASCLEKMGFGVEDGENLLVSVPCYRADILHEIDLVEDVAIGYGYQNFEPVLPKLVTTGEKHPMEKYCEKVRSAMIGYGFTEVMTLMLTNEESNFLDTKTEGEAVEIKNPISEEHTIVRTSLLSSLLEVLKINKHRELPQKIFEIGDVIFLDKDVETGALDKKKLCSCSIHSKASFTEIKSVVEGVLRDLGVKDYQIKRSDHASFIEGRRATIKASDLDVGYFGELHPEVITNFELEYPIIAFEIDLNEMMALK
ncbi:MAG: phenylalanine--tRNA ligase subunit beta [Candidatus Hydrothermarchaeales archaeon]